MFKVVLDGAPKMRLGAQCEGVNSATVNCLEVAWKVAAARWIHAARAGIKIRHPCIIGPFSFHMPPTDHRPLDLLSSETTTS